MTSTFPSTIERRATTITATALLFFRSFILCQCCPVQRDAIAHHLPTKNHQKIHLDYQPLNANAYFLPCNCMFLKCICNALAYAKVFQMSSFSKFTVPFMQLHDFLMQLQCKCIAQKCNCNANAFFGQRKENFPPHPLYKEKKKIKKRKLKKERFLHQ